MTARIVQTKLNNDSLIITVPKFGYELHYKMKDYTTVDADLEFKDGIPDFASEVTLEFVKVLKLSNAKSIKQIRELVKDESVIPPNLKYDHILLGFVYSDNTDSNNHRWWLDFKNDKDENVYNYFGDKIEIRCPTSTKSWFKDEFWHGRYVFSKQDIQSIIEPKPGRLIIRGKLKDECKPAISNQVIPSGAETIRFRYNTRENLWFGDILDKTDKLLGEIPCKNLIIDATMYGEIVTAEKPKVSTRINVNDILDINIAINTLIIRGK